MSTYVIAALAGYLLGSIPFGYLLVRLFRKSDIRETGSGNIGATNVIRSGAKWLGIATLFLDAGKGAAAALIGSALAQHALAPPAAVVNASAIAALAAIVGHVFPVWLRFKGGKGVATGLGVFLALSPVATLASLAIFLIVFLSMRFVSLASILGAASFPLAAALLQRGLWTPAYAACVILGPALIIAKHHENIRRLIAGTEHRWGSKGAEKAAQ
jgi:glycerol-3-phosphate acyltransferase PlsY